MVRILMGTAVKACHNQTFMIKSDIPLIRNEIVGVKIIFCQEVMSSYAPKGA